MRISWINLGAVLIDLTKAFDTLNREALSVILAKLGLGCTKQFVALEHLFFDRMEGLGPYHSEIQSLVEF